MQSVYIEFKGTFYLRTVHADGRWEKIDDQGRQSSDDWLARFGG